MAEAHPSNHHARGARWRLLVGGAVCTCVALLAACGSAAPAGPGARTGESTGTAVVRVTAVASTATASSTPTLKVPDGVTNCGYVLEGAFGTQPANALDIEACFYTAFQSCHPAALLYTNTGVDTQENYLFAVQPGANGTCSIARTVKNIGCCGSASHVVQITDSCSGVVKQNNAYVVTACGTAGNITLPS